MKVPLIIGRLAPSQGCAAVCRCRWMSKSFGVVNNNKSVSVAAADRRSGRWPGPSGPPEVGAVPVEASPREGSLLAGDSGERNSVDRLHRIVFADARHFEDRRKETFDNDISVAFFSSARGHAGQQTIIGSRMPPSRAVNLAAAHSGVFLCVCGSLSRQPGSVAIRRCRS